MQLWSPVFFTNRGAWYTLDVVGFFTRLLRQEEHTDLCVAFYRPVLCILCTRTQTPDCMLWLPAQMYSVVPGTDTRYYCQLALFLFSALPPSILGICSRFYFETGHSFLHTSPDGMCNCIHCTVFPSLRSFITKFSQVSTVNKHCKYCPQPIGLSSQRIRLN